MMCLKRRYNEKQCPRLEDAFIHAGIPIRDPFEARSEDEGTSDNDSDSDMGIPGCVRRRPCEVLGEWIGCPAKAAYLMLVANLPPAFYCLLHVLGNTKGLMHFRDLSMVAPAFKILA